MLKSSRGTIQHSLKFLFPSEEGLTDLRFAWAHINSTRLRSGVDPGTIPNVEPRITIQEVTNRFPLMDDGFVPQEDDMAPEGLQEMVHKFAKYVPTDKLPSVLYGIWEYFQYAHMDFFISDFSSQRDPDSNLDDEYKSTLDGSKLGPNGLLEWLNQGQLNFITI